jgi:hypothetical protein
MKKTIMLIAFTTFAVSFTHAQKKPAEQKAFKNDTLTNKLAIVDWEVYLRNIDRLSAFAGRNVPSSDLVLATKDTVALYQQLIMNQLKAQLQKPVADTIKPPAHKGE